MFFFFLKKETPTHLQQLPTTASTNVYLGEQTDGNERDEVVGYQNVARSPSDDQGNSEQGGKL